MKRILSAIAALFVTASMAATVTIPSQTVQVVIPAQSITIPDPVVIPPPVVTPPVVTPPVAGAIWEYNGSGVNLWTQDYSWNNVVAIYNDTSGAPVGTKFDIKVTINGVNGGWQPSHDPGVTIVPPPNGNFELDLKPTQPGQQWQLQAHQSDDEGNGVGPIIQLLNYGPAPVVGKWAHYKVPVKALMGALPALWKFGLQDSSKLASNVWYVNNVGFTP